MATSKKGDADVDADMQASAVAEIASVVFRDTVFTSRTLILPGDRQMLVVGGQVTAQVSDTVAMDYLKGHPDLLQE